MAVPIPDHAGPLKPDERARLVATGELIFSSKFLEPIPELEG